MKHLFLLLCSFFVFFSTATFAAVPKKIAYIEGGYFGEFEEYMKGIKEHLVLLGLEKSVVFPESMHVSVGWDASDAAFDAAADRLLNAKPDLIIVMGTKAGTAMLRRNDGRTKMMFLDVSDPVGSGFINKKTGKPVSPNLTVQYNSKYWDRIFKMFYSAIVFQKMGIIYHNSPEARTYSNLSSAREAARELGFVLVEDDGLDSLESMESCSKSIDNLIAKGIDAFYISSLNCFDRDQNNLDPLIKKLTDHGIKTYARDGTNHVKNNVMMGLTTVDFRFLGELYAKKAAVLLELLSKEEAKIPPESDGDPKIMLNMDTARKLGVKIPLMLMMTADGLFDASLPPLKSLATLEKEINESATGDVGVKD